MPTMCLYTLFLTWHVLSLKQGIVSMYDNFTNLEYALASRSEQHGTEFRRNSLFSVRPSIVHSQYVFEEGQTEMNKNPFKWKGIGIAPDFLKEYKCQPQEVNLKKFKTCGEGFCRCNTDKGDCSRHYGRLTYVPKLPRSVSKLYFYFNELTAINSDDFFVNVTQIVMLELGANGLAHLCPGAFSLLRNLRELSLMQNKLTFKMLAPVSSVKSLILLNLSRNPLGMVPISAFQNLSNLHTLCMSFAELTEVNMTAFSALPSLQHLELMGNYLTRNTFFPDFLPCLNVLLLTVNAFHTFPDTCYGSMSYMPNLTVLDVSENAIQTVPTDSVCLPHLKTLVFIMNTYDKIPNNAFGSHLFPALEVLVIGGGGDSEKITMIDRYAFNNSMLKSIVLDNADISFAQDSIHPDCLAGCPKLKELYLDGNVFREVSDHKLRRLLNHTNLSLLSLSNIGIGTITALMFSNLPRLEYLWLDGNKLTDLPDGVFDGLERLKLLDLSWNRITTVRESTIGKDTRQRLQYVTFAGNPFVCSCDLRWFQDWLDRQPSLFANCSVFFHTCSTYKCDNLPNTTVQSFYVADQACQLSPAVSKSIIAAVLLLTLPLAAAITLYRYRWHIRLLLYEAARGRTDQRRLRRLQEHHFRYDIFVSYDIDDLPWIREHLMPEIEQGMGLRLCLHQRDFIPGVPIVENIEESVESSKKLMMVFSKSFAKSHWCQFELQLCLTHVLEQGDTLLVVLLEDLPSRDLTPAMMAVMKTMTYIEWVDNPEARASYWGRIRLALHEINRLNLR